ncbi:hypothetical protein FNV43_RR07232 [Rhamnella rubrinervis]|uniref:Uncharacterized protein n=1 Tax=Rhamnella rubrinervis TaxID=2594499 RepID=A0A8K0HEE6_9ROSA|nr:hypothetical protein FNV43_RR07232 [Rhamnella rubrinervis]
MVLSLKEIVGNSTELEIYTMLKDYPFHEVKSKREKKKRYLVLMILFLLVSSHCFRIRTQQILGPCGANNSSNRRAGAERYLDVVVQTSSVLMSAGCLHSHGIDSVATENKMSTVGTGGTGDGILSSLQPSSGFQSAWLGVPGQVSMADIVKMGRPQSKASTMTNSSMHSVNHQSVPAPPSGALHHNLHLSQDHGSKEDDSAGVSAFDNNLYKDMTSYHPHGHAFEHNEAANLQQLNIEKDDVGAPPEEDGPLPLNSNLEEASTTVDVSAIGHSETRNPEYFDDEHLRSTSDENLIHRTGHSAGDYDSTSVSQAEVLKQETPEAGSGINIHFLLLHLDLLMKTLSTGIHKFIAKHFAGFNRSDCKGGSSANDDNANYLQGLRAGSISTPQPTQQTMPGASVATGPALPQHLAVHPYSQPTLPLGHFANMIGYPFLPQSYTHTCHQHSSRHLP